MSPIVNGETAPPAGAAAEAETNVNGTPAQNGVESKENKKRKRDRTEPVDSADEASREGKKEKKHKKKAGKEAIMDSEKENESAKEQVPK